MTTRRFALTSWARARIAQAATLACAVAPVACGARHHNQSGDEGRSPGSAGNEASAATAGASASGPVTGAGGDNAGSMADQNDAGYAGTHAAGTDGGGAANGDVFAGQWTGVWSATKDYGLSFVVDDNGQMRGFTLTDSATACGSTGSVEASAAGPVAIGTGGTFEITVVGCGPGVHCFTDHVSAMLKGDGTAQGTIRRYGSCSLGCASVSTGGTDRTWTAARDCTMRPTKGGSSLRFCDASGVPHEEALGSGGSSGSNDEVTCSVMPPAGGAGAGGSGPSGSPGSGGAGGSRPAKVTDLGEACDNPNCTAPAAWCYSNADSTCDSQWCVGSAGNGYCSQACASDADCSGGAVPMKCQATCNAAAPNTAMLAGHCWDETSYAAVKSYCGG